MIKKNETLRNINSAAAQLSSAQLSITLNFFQVYVYLLIIKYYSIYILKILKTYSNSFLNLSNFNLQKAFIYLNVFINIYLTEIMALKGFYSKIYQNLRRLLCQIFIKELI